MFSKTLDFIIEVIREEYKFLIVMILCLIILNYPVNYYIYTGGGVSDISSRVEVEGKYKSKGSFNLSYVTELNATVSSYLLSFIMPNWERQSTSSYKYIESETLEDIDFRYNLDLLVANSNATYWAYTLADKDIKLKDSKIYVISVDNDNFKSNLKIKDEILSMDGLSYGSLEEYRNYCQTKNENDTVIVRVKRDGKEIDIESKLTKVDNDRLLLGVILENYRKYTTNPKVDLHFFSNESGPSAGLMTTLEIYNQLTKKDLTKGYKIAGTGTIETDGSVGEIGGIEHKLLGAAKDNVDYFLSPGGDNYREAKKYIKKKNLKIKLIKIDSIENAINKLEELN